MLESSLQVNSNKADSFDSALPLMPGQDESFHTRGGTRAALQRASFIQEEIVKFFSGTAAEGGDAEVETGVQG